MYHLLSVSRNSLWCMSVALAVNGPRPRISPQTTGERTDLHVPGPPLVCAGANSCRPERLAVSSEGLCCHVISRVLFHVDVHTHQNTHRWKRLAASYFPIQLRCGKHIWLLLVFKLSVSCHFRTAMVCNWYCLKGPTLSVLALEFAAILRGLFFQQKPSYLTWKYENSVVESHFFKNHFFFFFENIVIHQTLVVKREAVCMFTHTFTWRHTRICCFYIKLIMTTD